MFNTYGLIEMKNMFIRIGFTSDMAMYFIAIDEANDNFHNQKENING